MGRGEQPERIGSVAFVSVGFTGGPASYGVCHKLITDVVYGCAASPRGQVSCPDHYFIFFVGEGVDGTVPLSVPCPERQGAWVS